jgi:thioredoxin reductase (NADPH)
MNQILDLVIIGGGPAGIAAAIYAKRAMMDFVVLEKWFPGGEIAKTYEVDNYPGIFHVSGPELADRMIDHAKALGVEFLMDSVVELDGSGPIKTVVTEQTTYQTKTIIIATGASPRMLGAIGEEDYIGRGVSNCATCDGALYKGKVAAVVGGGDVAVEDAIYLARMCKKVYLIHRRDSLRAAKVLQDKVFQLPNVELIWDSFVTEVGGTDLVNHITVKNKNTQAELVLDVDALFVAVGMDPNSAFVRGIIATDAGGWILTSEECETSVQGIFAAGDVRKKLLRQVVTSVADGAISVFGCERYL